jgi:hypothetical protein
LRRLNDEAARARLTRSGRAPRLTSRAARAWALSVAFALRNPSVSATTPVYRASAIRGVINTRSLSNNRRTSSVVDVASVSTASMSD